LALTHSSSSLGLGVLGRFKTVYLEKGPEDCDPYGGLKPGCQARSHCVIPEGAGPVKGVSGLVFRVVGGVGRVEVASGLVGCRSVGGFRSGGSPRALVGSGVPSPVPQRMRGGQPEGSGAGHSFAADEGAWSGTAIARWGSIKWATTLGLRGHDTKRARLPAGSEPHAAASVSRQRISPSLSP
jgi:hypothetical protein